MPKITELAKIKSGFKVLETDYKESGIRVITAGDIKDDSSIIITENRFIEASDRSVNHLLDSGDILLVSVGSKIGNNAIFMGNDPTIANQNLLVIKPLGDPQELFNQLVKKHSSIVGLAIGQAMQCIVIKDLGEFDI